MWHLLQNFFWGNVCVKLWNRDKVFSFFQISSIYRRNLFLYLTSLFNFGFPCSSTILPTFYVLLFHAKILKYTQAISLFGAFGFSTCTSFVKEFSFSLFNHQLLVTTAPCFSFPKGWRGKTQSGSRFQSTQF